MSGYHLKKIEKGVVGELSKIKEELEECFDAEAQGCKVMVIVELSDLVGAINHYLSKNYPSISLQDLNKMAEITKRAFDNGRR